MSHRPTKPTRTPRLLSLTRSDRFFGLRQVPMLRRVAYVIGAVVVAAGLAMLPAAVTSLIYGERETAGLITLAALITALAGLLSWRGVGRSGTLTTKEGFASVGLAWFAMSIFGMLPYL
ncbi:MAG: hypothetical protein OXH95_06615, partial [bacterium]|nr:hypothetical protein [bacterium]